MPDILYEHYYYLMKETKKPKYLDFYELEDTDLKNIECYLEQTVRYKNKWYFIEFKKKYFYTEEARKNAPKYMIKELYQKATVL